MRRALSTFVACVVMSAQAAWANPQVDQLVDAMGMPALVDIFAIEGQEAGVTLDQGLLNGQGGTVFAEMVRQLYDPARLQQELRAGMADALDPDAAAQALLFFESELGARIVDLEIQARRTLMDSALESAAKSAPSAQGDAVSNLLTVRDLVERNSDTSMQARIAFVDGMAAVTGPQDTPDFDAQRDAVRAETESWLRGYYALAQSPLSADDIAIYTAFWETDVGQAVDAAVFEAFGASYTTLSFALGQAVGRLLPQNEL
ncbi:DUF2059 domain-containing protein [Tateyamaria sp.]|uniref:DUF2059 domain-containing protein n=1 Tax=Tateyamaria sp. TaxID=1929288 RepID=UPI00329A9A3D